MKLSNQAAQIVKLHYSAEYHKTLKYLKELKQVLEELKDIDIPVGENDIPQVILANQEFINNKSNARALTPKRPYKKRAKKRGRKSKWGDFILKRLRAVNRPLTYDELANHAQVSLTLPSEEYDKTRRALVGAVFQLRNKQNKVKTFPKSNSRDKYVLLIKWVNENNTPLDTMKAYME